MKNTPIPSSPKHIFVENCVSSEEALEATSTENPSAGCISAVCVTNATCEPDHLSGQVLSPKQTTFNNLPSASFSDVIQKLSKNRNFAELSCYPA